MVFRTQSLVLRGCRRAGLTLLLALTALASHGAPAPGTADAPAVGPRVSNPNRVQEPIQPDQVTYEAAKPLEHVLSRSRHGQLTVGDVREYARTGRLQLLSQLDPERTAELPADVLRRAAELITILQEARAQLAKTTDTQAQAIAKNVDQNIVLGEAVRQLTREYIQDKVTTVTEAAARAYYDKHIAEFEQVFQFRMRHLILLTYKPHVVQDGETLESIAAAAGNGVTSATIRADMPGRPPRYQEDAMFKPLENGETLLVPMAPAEVALKRNQLEAILKQHDESTSETTFAALAKKYSENELKGEETDWLPSGTRPMVAELLKAAQDTPVGGISPIFETKHGVQVIQVTGKKQPGTKPFEEVREQITQSLVQKQQEELSNALLDLLANQPGFTINTEKFQDPEKNTTDTVVATVGKTPIQWETVRRLWEGAGTRPTPENIKKAIRMSREVQLPMILLWAEPILANPEHPMTVRVERLRDLMLGNDQLDRVMALELSRDVTPERVERYYKEHPDEFKAPERVAFMATKRVISLEDDNKSDSERAAAIEGMVQTLKRDLSTAKSADEFRSLAAQINEVILIEPQRPPQSPQPMPLNDVPLPWRDELAKLKPGQWSEPFALPDGVGAVLLIDHLPAGLLPLEQVSDRVRSEVFRQISATTEAQAPAELLKQSEFAWVDAPAS